MSEDAGTTSVGEDATKPGWAAQLSDDLKSNETLTRFQTISDLGKAFIDADGKLKNAVPVLKEGASDKERAEYFAKLGRPESPEKYNLERPKLPEGMQYDEAAEKHFRGEAHKLGLTQSQMAGLYAAYNALQTQGYDAAMKQSAENLKTADAALKAEWGDKHAVNLELAQRAVIWLGGQKLKDELDRTGLGNNPELAKAFASVGLKMADDKTVIGDKGGVPSDKPTGYTHKGLDENK